jgi:SAM-dependent methyltransferase
MLNDAYAIPSPPQNMMDDVAGRPTSPEQHFEMGRRLRRRVEILCALKPGESVLDLGCGCGRVAAHFAADFDGPYHGLDIVAPMIDWCRANITRPNFQFHHADLDNTRYRGGAGDAAAFTFPFADASFDVVFAFSLFTHLLPPAARRYTGEIARVLRPGGRALLTFFLYMDLLPVVTSAFPYKLDGCRIASREAPEAVVAYDETTAAAMVTMSDLQLFAVHKGAWSTGEGDWPVQDTIVAVRPA